ncbi:hypothetical protein Cgig2_012396 [Carnegiea gigantea]|uniref:Uncharacterized protein n=1 Tax=Carnegiea gigantea TaxID=171969 RepID=A0A9Q1JTJ1_9CARY|nr:hypothetical protein Cgig2_012396 [Carnegiea gigantea]
MDFALYKGPWAFNSCTLRLKEINGMQQLLKVKFNTARFRVKAYDVSRLKQMSSFAKFLGNNIGAFIGCDEKSLGGGSESPYLFFLIKTKLARVEMMVVKVQLGEFDGEYPDSRGHTVCRDLWVAMGLAKNELLKNLKNNSNLLRIIKGRFK